jgi:hypothetical protein
MSKEYNWDKKETTEKKEAGIDEEKLWHFGYCTSFVSFFWDDTKGGE